MVLIQVMSKDKEKVFEILSDNGRFIGLSKNRFSILEHTGAVVKKLDDVGIKYKRLD